MKTCFKCLSNKPLSEFYRHPRMADGHLGKCKDCTKSDARQREDMKSKDPEWVESETVRHRNKSRRYRELGIAPKPDPAASARWANRNPKKRNAHHAVYVALRDGCLTKLPCAICGDQKSEAHHEDYSRPLDVVWLCVTCHNERHNEIRKCMRLKAPIPPINTKQQHVA